MGVVIHAEHRFNKKPLPPKETEREARLKAMRKKLEGSKL